MATQFKNTTYPMSTLVGDIELGRLALPDIQRPFVWPNTKVRDLFDSMYRGYPVGYLLFWQNNLTEKIRTIGTERKQSPANLLIIDGQQRLTSLYAVYKGVPVIRSDYRQERIVIAFNALREIFEVPDVSTSQNPEFLPDISLLWSPNQSFSKIFREYIQRLNNHGNTLTEQDIQRAEGALERVRSLVHYPFIALELSSNVGEEEVAEVFVRINSKGTRLNQSDFILTLMSVFWEEGRAELETFCRQAKTPSVSAASPFNYFITPSPDQMLRAEIALGFRRARLQHVYSILRGKDLDTEQFSADRRDQQFFTLQDAQAYTLNIQNWHEFLKALILAGHRSKESITSEITILYSYALFLIGRREFKVPIVPLRRIIAQWFFMATLTSRYIGGSESVFEADLARLRDISGAEAFIRTLQKVIQDKLSEDFWTITLPNDLEVSSARTPALFAYQAAQVLLGARALFSDMPVEKLIDPSIRARKSGTERHHLFPKKYLNKMGITETKATNQVANYALLEWHENISISDKAPQEYLPQVLAKLNWPDEERARQYYWHALPPGWESMEYQAFLGERRKRMAAVIRDGFKVLQSGVLPEPTLPIPQLGPIEPDPGNGAEDDGNKTAYASFWWEFIERSRSRTNLFSHRKEPSNSRGLYRRLIEYKDIWYYLTLRAHSARVGLSIEHSNVEWNTRVFDILHSQAAEMEDKLGLPLNWQTKRITRQLWVSASETHGLLDKEHWEDLQITMLDRLVRLEQVIVPYLRDAVASVGEPE